MEGPSAWDEGNDGLYTALAPGKKPFSVLPQPLVKVLREQLGPGELDAAARVCKAWASQLAHDVVHCEMCLPASYEQLLCQLEQLSKRFKNVHSWKLWLAAGNDWAVVEELKLLWLLSRYKAEKLQLDGRLYWNTKDPDLPTLDADVLPWMPSLRSLQTLSLSHCTLADPSGLRYLSFLPDLTSLTFGITATQSMESEWSSNGLARILPYLCKLQQVAEVEIHIEGASQLAEGQVQQVRQVFAACGRLQRFRVLLGRGWGLIRDSESVMFERIPSPDRQADWLNQPLGSTAADEPVAGAALQPHQQRRMRWLAMMDPAAARAATAAGLDLSTYLLPDPSDTAGLHNPAGGLHNPAAVSSHLMDADSDDDSFWPSPLTVAAGSRVGTGSARPGPALQQQQQGLALQTLQQRAPHIQQSPAAGNLAAAAPPPAAALGPGNMVRDQSPIVFPPFLQRLESRASQQRRLKRQRQQQQQAEGMAFNLSEAPTTPTAAAGDAGGSSILQLDTASTPAAAPSEAAMTDAAGSGDIGGKLSPSGILTSCITKALAADKLFRSNNDDSSDSDEGEQYQRIMQRMVIQHRVAGSPRSQGAATAAAAGSSGGGDAAQQPPGVWAFGVVSYQQSLHQHQPEVTAATADTVGMSPAAEPAAVAVAGSEESGLSVRDLRGNRHRAIARLAALGRRVQTVPGNDSSSGSRSLSMTAAVAAGLAAVHGSGSTSTPMPLNLLSRELGHADVAPATAAAAATAATSLSPLQILGRELGSCATAPAAAPAAASAGSSDAVMRESALPLVPATTGTRHRAQDSGQSYQFEMGSQGLRARIYELRRAEAEVNMLRRADESDDDMLDRQLDLNEWMIGRRVPRLSCEASRPSRQDRFSAFSWLQRWAHPAGQQAAAAAPAAIGAAAAAPAPVQQPNQAAENFLAAAAVQVAAAPAPPAAAPPVTAPLRMPQLNRCVLKPDSVLVTHLKLIGLTGPAVLHHRLKKLLSASPAIALQDVELHFSGRGYVPTPPPAAAAAGGSNLGGDLCVEGGGRFWQLLLRQMLLVRGLKVCGLRYCEAADDAPHFWRAVGQLRGLTKLCFDSSKGDNAVAAPLLDVHEPPAATAKHVLTLDALFMQVVTCRLQGLRTLKFHGEIPAPAAAVHLNCTPSCYASLQPTGHYPSSSSSSKLDPSHPVLSYLTKMTNLTSLSLHHDGIPVSSNCSVQLDMAWLPDGLTRLKLSNLALSCQGIRSVTSAAAAAGYMALLLQQRRANTPDAFVAAAAAADEKGKIPVKLLPPGVAAALGLQGHPGSSSSSSSSTYCIPQLPQPPVILRNLHDLDISNCYGVQAAVIGCLAHSTGLKVLSLAVTETIPEPLSLAAIAWTWPRLQTVDFSTPRVGTKKHTPAAAAAAAAAGGGGVVGVSGHMLLPDLLDSSVTPDLAAAWLWQLDAPPGSSSSSGGCGGSSSSAAAASVHTRLLADICSRGSSSSSGNSLSWADPEDLAMFASGLANLCKLNLMFGSYYSSSIWGSDGSTSLFRPMHLLGLLNAQRLRELVVDIPAQPKYQAAAAEIRSLTQLSRLRLLDLKCNIQPAIIAERAFMQREANASRSAAAGGFAAAPTVGSIVANWSRNARTAAVTDSAATGSAAGPAANAAGSIAIPSQANTQPPAAEAGEGGALRLDGLLARPETLLGELDALLRNRRRTAPAVPASTAADATTRNADRLTRLVAATAGQQLPLARAALPAAGNTAASAAGGGAAAAGPMDRTTYLHRRGILTGLNLRGAFSGDDGDDEDLYEFSESDSEAEAAAALGRDAAAAVAADVAAPHLPQPPPPAAAENSSSSMRRRRHLPSELLDEMRTSMPNTSVFLQIYKL